MKNISYSGPGKAADKQDFTKFHPLQDLNIGKCVSRHEETELDNQIALRSNLDVKKRMSPNDLLFAVLL